MRKQQTCGTCLGTRTEATSYGDHQWDIPWCRSCTPEGRRWAAQRAARDLRNAMTGDLPAFDQLAGDLAVHPKDDQR